MTGPGTEPGPGAASLEALARELAGPGVPPQEAWRAGLVTLRPGERPALEALCRDHGLHLLDTLDRQLAELSACVLPGAGEAERRRWVAERVEGAGDAAALGCWAHLPWERRVAHVLDAADYAEVVTNRNRDKITREEQAVLGTKRIAVLGLSVGAEAAVTVAQEHLCGQIVLADFDRLDLSNLNRLQGGFADVGLPKTTLAARRIAHLDPHLQVEVVAEGVHEGNLEAFLRGADLLLEECDGLAMKFRVREAARDAGVDIVFAADERGFLSVEPHGSRPGLPLFHGRVAAPQGPKESYATPLDHMKALTEWMGGWDRVSERSRRSLEQIGSTLCGYPQLAGEARLAAGQVAHVARRLLLGERLDPAIHHLDLDELVRS